ncbi:flagellar hook-associated protein FlgL [Bermanella sp. R86510]|uniref:flagellar hook-associated protein FlgL n=1 Tax=unclassified Bermanella TaxID=2627862 RepID=UPI0037C9F070
MRISTMQQFNSGVRAILNNQESTQRTQQQISTGRRVLTPADDPIAATQILQLQQDISLRDQYEKNITSARNKLELEESTLGGVIENIERIRELTVDAGNGSLSKEDRGFIAAELEERLDALVDQMNTKDASNTYIFAGFKGETIPFEERQGGGVVYKGDDGQRFLEISNSTKVQTNDTGKKIFTDIQSNNNTFYTRDNERNQGNGFITNGFVSDQEAYDEFYPKDMVIQFNPDGFITPPGPNYSVLSRDDNRAIDGFDGVAYSQGNEIVVRGANFKIAGQPEPGDTFFVKSSPKQSLTDTVAGLVEGLRTLDDNPEDSASLDVLIENSLTNLDFAQSSVSEVRSEIGARLNTVENIENLHKDVDLVSKNILSQLQDVDFAEAVSRLSLESLLLEASQQSFAQISRLTLFNKL